jgi:hypothetical protein
MKQLRLIGLSLITWFISLTPSAAGLLTPVNEQFLPLKIHEHHVDVMVEDGCVANSVTQEFYNLDSQDLEAIDSCPKLEKGGGSREIFVARGVEQRNYKRIEREVRRQQPVSDHRANRKQSICQRARPCLGSGGGSLGYWVMIVLIGLMVVKTWIDRPHHS